MKFKTVARQYPSHLHHLNLLMSSLHLHLLQLTSSLFALTMQQILPDKSYHPEYYETANPLIQVTMTVRSSQIV